MAKAPLPSLETPLANPDVVEPIYAAFLAACRRTPHATAIVHLDSQYSYKQVEHASRALAIQLLTRHRKEDVVGICSRRSPEVIVGMLACLRTGIRFAVLDFAYPEARLQDLLSVAQPTTLLCAGMSQEEADATSGWSVGLPTICISLALREGSPQPTDERSPGLDDVSPSDIAYLLFTSGTTGKPKCIQTTHAPLVHFVRWYTKALRVDALSKVSMLSGLGHDPVLRDIFVPLSCGATVFILPTEDLVEPLKLFNWFSNSNITHAHATPQLARILCAGGTEASSLPDLKVLCLGGDVLRWPLVDAVQRLASSCRVVNFYGSSETPQAMAYHVCEGRDAAQERVPIGRAIDDVELFIVNDSLHCCKPNETGQIVIRTHYLSAGYLGDRRLTGEKFVANPLTSNPQDVLYLTGDMGYRSDSGLFMLTGRRDDQVKIRGYRVELNDISSHLESMPEVENALVLPDTSPEGEIRLTAYLTAAAPHSKAGVPVEMFRSKFAAQVPAYMVPFQFIWVETFPLLPNGKIDRVRLRKTKIFIGSESRQASNPVEADIAKAWKNSLGHEDIPLDISFIDLGGDSLSYIQTTILLEPILGNLPPSWEKLTIRELAAHRRVATGSLTRVETSVLIRALSIVSIVSTHLQIYEFMGSAVVLFVVSGMSLGRYLIPAVLHAERAHPVLRMVIKIYVPTVIYTTMLDVVFFKFKWQSLFLVQNYAGSFFADRGFHFWFIEVLLQCQLGLAALLSVGRVRAVVRSYPFASPFVACWLSAVMYWAMPQVWNTRPLYDHVPHMNIGFLILGWAIVQADTSVRKIAVSAAAMVLFSLASWHEHTPYWLPVVATFFLLHIPRISVPRRLGTVVRALAGSSFFIYLTDLQTNSLLKHFPVNVPVGVRLGVALAVGYLVSKAWEKITAVVTARSPGPKQGTVRF
jgi:amino acid adenylation domain-containing protein